MCSLKHAFIEVRTNRNRDKITREETETLRSKTVGIAGLSVGQSHGRGLAMERGCGRLKLADFDVIELSNLNRIRCSVHRLNCPSGWWRQGPSSNLTLTSTSRSTRMAWTQPTYADFLEGCDVVVDACDSLAVKAQLRLERPCRKGVLL